MNTFNIVKTVSKKLNLTGSFTRSDFTANSEATDTTVLE